MPIPCAAPQPRAIHSVKTAELRANIADAVNRVAYGRERVVLTRRGRAVAALVSIEDLDVLQRQAQGGAHVR